MSQQDTELTAAELLDLARRGDLFRGDHLPTVRAASAALAAFLEEIDRRTASPESPPALAQFTDDQLLGEISRRIRRRFRCPSWCIVGPDCDGAAAR